MTIVADYYTHVVGVDTHAKTHTFAIIETRTGAHRLTGRFPTHPAGLSRALGWVARHTTGLVLMVVEGTGSYGAQLTGLATLNGLMVVEANPGRSRRSQKTDDLDAEHHARSVLGVELNQLRIPRTQDGIRVGLRVLVNARDQMTTNRTRMKNQLIALVRSVNLGVDGRAGLSGTMIKTISAWRARDEHIEVGIARREAIRLAQKICDHDVELKENNTQISNLVKASWDAHIMDQVGIGPVNAAKILIAWSHSGRISSESKFAALAGVSPVSASSGNTVRHRLNRGGDRGLNQAFDSIVMTRKRFDEKTKAYVDRRTSEGKTPKEITRCLKRYVVRQVFKLMNKSD